MKTRRDKYAVVTVYNEDDGAQPLVHVVDVYNTPKAAMKRAESLVNEILAGYNRELKTRRKEAPEELVKTGLFDPLKFEDCWERVDNGVRGWLFRDWGFDPIDHCFGCRVRVVTWDEPARKEKSR